MLRSNNEYARQRAGPLPPPSPSSSSSQAMAANAADASSLPDQYSPPNLLSRGLVPPLLHSPPPSSDVRPPQQQQLHSAPQASLSRAGQPYAALTPEREDALRAKGRQLLEEHRREIAGGDGVAYSPEERAALQQRGMELLRAAREEAAANGGQHVPAPLLSAAARVAAATAATTRRRGRSSGHDGRRSHSSHRDDSGEGGEGDRVNEPAAAALVHSPQQQTTQSQTKEAHAVAAAPQPPMQELMAEVARLRQLVAAQQAELSATHAAPPPPAPPSSPSSSQSAEVFTAAQLESARQDLIRQFNQHMAQCEQANQNYWAQVSAEHQQVVTTLQNECAALKREIAATQSAQHAENESAAEAAASLHQAVTVLKRELNEAQQECAAARLAREAAEQEVHLLTEQLREQSDELVHLQNQLSAAVAEMQAAHAETEQAARTGSAELQAIRDRLLESESAYSELEEQNAELRAANARLEASALTATPAVATTPPTHDAANPFADEDAEDPFGGPSNTVSIAAPFAASAPAVDHNELHAARQRIAELQERNDDLAASNAELKATIGRLEAARVTTAFAAPAVAAHDVGNPFVDEDAEDPFGGSSHAAPAAAPAVSSGSAAADADNELAVARQRIAELEARCADLEAVAAELEAANAKRDDDPNTAVSAAARAPHEGDAEKPFADGDAEDPCDGFSHAAPLSAPTASDESELTAARQRIAELEEQNAELRAANARLEASALTATPAVATTPPTHDAANPFADEDAEDPFGGPSNTVSIAAPFAASAPAVDHNELHAARQRIAELQERNDDLAASNAELKATIGRLEAARVTTAFAAPAVAAHDVGNPFVDEDAEDPFGGSSHAAPAAAPAVSSGSAAADADNELAVARQRIAELEARCADLEAVAAELEAANAKRDDDPNTAVSAAARAPHEGDAEKPFADGDAEDPCDGFSHAAPLSAPTASDESELTAARQRIAELEEQNAELRAANARLEASALTATPAVATTPPTHDAANPFADEDAEDPFGGPSNTVSIAAPFAASAPAVDHNELHAARQRIAELQERNDDLAASNAELKATIGRLEAARVTTAFAAPAVAAHDVGNPFVDEDAEDPFGGSSHAAPAAAPAVSSGSAAADADNELAVARQRIAELEARCADLEAVAAELEAANAKRDDDPNTAVSAAARAPHEGDAEKPFADGDAEDPCDGFSHAAPLSAPTASDESELTAARQRIAELEEQNAELRAANARLEASALTATPAVATTPPTHDAANPFADEDAEDPFGGPSNTVSIAAPFAASAPAVDHNELHAARQRIAELQERNDDLAASNAELKATIGRLEAARVTTAFAAPAVAAHDVGNPFVDEDAEDPFGGSSHAAPAAAPAVSSGSAAADADNELAVARQRIAELEARCADLEAVAAELEAANAKRDDDPNTAVSAAARAPHEGDAEKPFADGDAEDPCDGFSHAAPLSAPTASDESELTAARQRIAELEEQNAELRAANARLEASALTATPAVATTPPTHDAANPFADEDAEDPFGGPSNTVSIAAPFAASAPAVDHNELHAARQRIAELQERNDDLAASNAELKATIGRLEAARVTTAFAAPAVAAHDVGNPFVDEDAEDPFGGSSHAAPAAAPAVSSGSAAADADNELAVARQRIAELEARCADLEAVAAELEAANAKRDDDPNTAVSAAARAPHEGDAEKPFADGDAEDPCDGFSHAAPLSAPTASDESELTAARQRIAELEEQNAELRAANARLEASALTATPAVATTPPTHDAANPFADEDAEDPFGGPSNTVSIAAPFAASAPAVDHNELHAARQRIAELQERNDDLAASNAELKATIGRLEAARVTTAFAAPAVAAHDVGNPFVDEDAEDPFGGSSHAAPAAAPAVSSGSAAADADNELAVARQHIADLEDALSEAAADIEKLQEDLEEKEYLIQALRAGEAALGSLPADMGTSSGSGWGVVLPSNSVDEPSAEDTLPGLRARVAELTRQLTEERRAHRRTVEKQQQLAASSPKPLSQSSQLVPGMEELGRQYADVQHRLSLAEETSAELEVEVQRLRERSSRAEELAAAQPSVQTTANVVEMPDHALPLAGTAVENPFAERDESDEAAEEGDDLEAAVVTIRSSRVRQQSSLHGNNSQGDLPRPPLPHPTLFEKGEEEDDDDGGGHNTPETQVSFHMDRSSTAPHGPHELVNDSVFGEGEDIECRGSAFTRDPYSSPGREEEQSETQTTSAAVRGDEAARGTLRERSGELFDDEETAEDVDVSVSTRVAAARGRIPPPHPSKVEDSGIAMQRLGRQYAEAQQRLLRSEETRQSLENEVAELRHMLEQLQASTATPTATAATSSSSPNTRHHQNDHHNHHHPNLERTCAGHSGNELDEDPDEEEEVAEATRTMTTSSASSVPTAAREWPTPNPLGTPTVTSEEASQHRVSSGRADKDDADFDPATTATHSEQGVAAEHGDSDPQQPQQPGHYCQHNNAEAEKDAAAINAALYRRIAELETELQTAMTNYEEELQAVADAAADRIAALEQEYAAATATKAAETPKATAREESDVFGLAAAASESGKEAQQVDQTNAELSDASPLAVSATGAAPDSLAIVAAARVEWEADMEEERQVHQQRVHACEREIEALKADIATRDVELEVLRNKDQANQENVQAVQTKLADARQAYHDIQIELQHAQERLTFMSNALEEMQAAHKAELDNFSAECDRTIEEHDELLRQRLEEQETSYEEAVQQLDQQHQDQLRLLASSSAEEAATSHTRDEGEAEKQRAEAAHWKEQHDVLQERFDQLQRDYDDFAQDTAALQRRLREQEAAQREREQSRPTRDAAAQQLTTVQKRLEEMTRLVEAAQADAQTRSSELRDTAARHAEVESTLRAELATLRAQAQSSREEVAKLNSLNEELSELLQQGATGVEAALRDRDAQLSALEMQVQDLKLQLAAAGDRVAERQTQLLDLRDLNDTLQQQAEESKASIRSLESQLRESKRASEEQCRTAAQKADRAVRDAEQARVAAQQALAEQHASHQGDIAALQRQLDDLRDELEVAQTVAATVPLEAQKHQCDLETVRERLTEALRTQQELQQQLKNSRGEVERQRRLLRGVNADGSEVDASAAAAAADDDVEGVPTGAADARVNALLRTVEELEEKLQETSTERDTLQQERDRVTMQLKSAARVADVKEQAARRQEAELRGMRGQLATIRDDLAQRVQSNHALQLEIDHLHERVADLTSASAELQDQYAAEVERRTTQEHAEALFFAKAMTIPRVLEDHVRGLCAGYHTLLQVSSKDRTYVYERCDTIEKAAGEAMAEAEAQSHAYEAALADAQEEQQQLKAIIEQLEEALHKAEQTRDTAAAEAKTAKQELEAVQRQSREDVFNAQRDLQVAELQHADTLHSLSLLQDEVTNTAALIKNQKATYERRESELAEEVAQLQAELETRKASARLLQQSTEENRNELQDVVDAAEQRRDQAVREAQALRAQLDRVLPRLAQLEDEQAQRTADLMDTAQQLSALHKKSSSTEEVSRKHIEELNQTLQELLHAHTVLQRTHTTTEATADRLKTQLESTAQELVRTTTTAQQQEEELTQLRGRLQEVETRTSRIIADEQARLRDADRRIQGLEQRNAALQQECKSLQEAHQSLRVELESTADALQRRTETANAQEQQQAHQIRLLRERTDTLEAERQELLSAEQSITKERDGCQREILQLKHKVEHLQRHLSDANDHNNTLNQEMVELKTEHSGEVDRLRDAITDAQKELAKCRQLLAEAETHQVEQDSTHYSLTTEMNVLREELKSARAQAERAVQQYQKEKTEREEMATLLQSQIAQLYEELRSKQEQLRELENTSASQQDTISALRQGVAELEEQLRLTRKELLDMQEAATAAKEHHRRDRFELQSKLNDAEDAAAELKRQQEQYRERMTTKVELYEVAEQALRGEVTDLRADVARLEEALAATTQGKDAAEDMKSRQAHSIRAVESEVQALRAQTAKDMAELSALKVQLQQRTTEVERMRRESAAQLAAEKLKWEAAHAAACDALEEALRKEQQATKDAREARERALASLTRKTKDVATMEEECRGTRAQLRQLQRRVDVAEYQLTALEGMARDSAADLGVSLAELMGGTSITDERGLIAPDSQLDTSSGSIGGGGAAAHTAAVAAAGASVQAVLDELVRRLNVFTFAANTLDTEDAQLTALSHALEQLLDAVDAMAEAGMGGDGASSAAANYTGGATPLRGGGAALGLNNTPATRGAGVLHGGNNSKTGLPRLLTSGQQIIVQQISQASSTYVHRVEDHVRTAQQMLRAVVLAVGAQEVLAGSPSTHHRNNPHLSNSSGSIGHQCPTMVALSSRHRLQVAATIAELHRRTATLTRAVDRVTEIIVGSPAPFSGAAAAAGGVCGLSDCPGSPVPSPLTANLQMTLQELRRLLAEAERYALLPFNELLCTGGSGGDGAASSTGGAAAASEQSYGGRGRQGDGLRTSPLRTQQPQQQQAPPSATSSVSAAGHRASAPDSAGTRRTMDGAAYGGSTQLTVPPPMVSSPPRRVSGAAPSRTQADDSGIVSTLSPIPPDEEANWF